MYANRVTKSMKKTIEETSYIRKKQKIYNKKFNITPTPLDKSINDVFTKEDITQDDPSVIKDYAPYIINRCL